MLPSEDAIWVGRELTRRFGLARWQFALTATDANRFAIRLARELTGRPKVLVFNWCYHGTVDETFVGARRRDGRLARRQRRAAGAARRDDARRRVERPRGARARARSRRRRLRAGRAGADEHRHRPARAGLPRAAACGDARDGDAADHRRDAHALRRAGRVHRSPRARARPAHGRQVDRRGHPGRGVRLLGGGRRAARGAAPGRREVGHRRHRRHARRERALARRHARDARRGADRRGLRADDRPRRALRGRRRGHDRASRPALARDAPRLPGRVPLPPRASA